MQNTLTDLNNHLFEALERLNDDELDENALEREIKRCDATVRIADAIIQTGKLALDTMKHLDEYGIKDGKDVRLAPMLTAKDK